jgi:acyl carrier protein
MQKRIEKIFFDLFGVKPEVCCDTLAPKDIEAWNSVNHLTLVMSLEEEFCVEFSPEEIADLGSIGAVKAALAHHGVA